MIAKYFFFFKGPNTSGIEVLLKQSQTKQSNNDITRKRVSKTLASQIAESWSRFGNYLSSRPSEKRKNEVENVDCDRSIRLSSSGSRRLPYVFATELPSPNAKACPPIASHLHLNMYCRMARSIIQSFSTFNISSSSLPHHRQTFPVSQSQQHGGGPSTGIYLLAQVRKFYRFHVIWLHLAMLIMQDAPEPKDRRCRLANRMA